MRYIPNTKSDLKEMLDEIGISYFYDIVSNIPEKVRVKGELNLPSALSEQELSTHMNRLAMKNASFDCYSSFLGAGTYNHFIPAVVDKIILRSEFYTSYTPYQPEISQGTLQSIFEFQTLICQLTGMDVANASMYDGATAMTEAAIMCNRINKRQEILVSETVHPEYLEVLKTYTKNINLEIKTIPFSKDCGTTEVEWLRANISDKTSCVIIQNPNFFGSIEDLKSLGKLAHENGALFVVSIPEPLSLGLIKPPGNFDADIVTMEGQSFGNNVSFGGPHLGIFAAKKKFVRNMPGRLVGKTVDKDGKTGFVLTLSTREQHIRRDKATSNICSNESLCALAAAIHLIILGKNGIKDLALLNYNKAMYAKSEISKVPGFKVKFNSHSFNEFVIETDMDIEILNKRLLNKYIIGGFNLKRFFSALNNSILFCVTEMISKKEIDNLCEVLKGND